MCIVLSTCNRPLFSLFDILSTADCKKSHVVFMIHYMGTIPMYDNETIDTMCIKLVVDDFGLYLMVL